MAGETPGMDRSRKTRQGVGVPRKSRLSRYRDIFRLTRAAAALKNWAASVFEILVVGDITDD
jgi:hypothetical protein